MSRLIYDCTFIQLYIHQKLEVLWYTMCSFFFRPVNPRGIEDVSFAEAEFGDKNSDSEEEFEYESDVTGTGLQRILSTEDQGELTDDETFLVYLNPIMNLARMNIPRQCPHADCRQDVDIKQESIGSALYLKWVIICF